MTKRILRMQTASWVVVLALSTPTVTLARPLDASIAARAHKVLRTTEGVTGPAIHVDVANGRVTLRGRVGSADEKAKAEQAVRRIAGVKDVRNHLQVTGRSANVVKKSDHDLTRRVEAALANQDTWRQRELREAGRDREAADAARDIWNASPTRRRLVEDSPTPGLNILSVDTVDGRVKLFGAVPAAEAKALAEENARKVGGALHHLAAARIAPSAVGVKSVEDERRVSDR